jgi:hypothetical protein
MKALKTVPNDMSSAYKNVMHRIEKSRSGNDTELALRILSYLFHAQRTLHIDELLEALAISPQADGSDDENCDGEHEIVANNMLEPAQVVECCQGLVLYEECSGLVRFAHFTVQEFINRNLQ